MQKSRRMTRLRKAGAILLVLLVGAGLLLWFTAWGKLPHIAPPRAAEHVRFQIMSAREYRARIDHHARPYVYEILADRGAVLIYGAEHTKNPGDPQIADIERRWTAFRPSLALCESDLGILFPLLMDPVREFGEPGALCALARRDAVPVFTWEPHPHELVARLLRRHPARQVAARLMLGPYFSNLRHGRPDHPEAFVEEYRAKRQRWPGLEQTFGSVAEIDAFWRSEFPDGPDWRNVSDAHGLPGFLADIDVNQPRDEHFVAIVLQAVERGERVFAVCGSSHAVKIEPALQAMQSAGGKP